MENVFFKSNSQILGICFTLIRIKSRLRQNWSVWMLCLLRGKLFNGKIIFDVGECRANRKMSMKIPLLRVCANMHSSALWTTLPLSPPPPSTPPPPPPTTKRESFSPSACTGEAVPVAARELVSLSSIVNGMHKYVLDVDKWKHYAMGACGWRKAVVVWNVNIWCGHSSNFRLRLTP